MFWVVRVDSFWYQCDTIDEAERQYQHILDNINGKYKDKDKVYIAEYGGAHPRILKMWTRPQKEQEEEFGYGK